MTTPDTHALTEAAKPEAIGGREEWRTCPECNGKGLSLQDDDGLHQCTTCLGEGMIRRPLAAKSGEVTYPPEMLPSPDEGQEADVFVQNDDGSLRKVYSTDTAKPGGEDLVATITRRIREYQHKFPGLDLECAVDAALHPNAPDNPSPAIPDVGELAEQLRLQSDGCEADWAKIDRAAAAALEASQREVERLNDEMEQCAKNCNRIDSERMQQNYQSSQEIERLRGALEEIYGKHFQLSREDMRTIARAALERDGFTRMMMTRPSPAPPSKRKGT